MSYSSSNHSSGRSVKFRDLEDGAGDASGSRTSKMSAALQCRKSARPPGSPN